MGICTVALALLLAIVGVQSADKTLGETCATSDTCVHPTLQLACSIKDGDTTKTCLIKVGESCAGGLSDSCVAGAECTTNTCSCKTSIYTASGGVCTVNEDLWAGACPASGTCTGAGLECNSGLSMCICVADKAVALATGTCTVSIAASKVGKSCTASTATTDCGSSANLACVSGKCKCDTGYTGAVGGACTAISTNGLIGKACTTANQATNCGVATTTFMTCSSLFCACQTGYTGIPGIACYPAAGKLNGGCSGTNQGTCSETTMECVGTGAKSCKSALASACTVDADCSSTTTMACDPLVGICLLKVGQTCTNNQDKCRAGAKCTGNTGTTCACDTTISTDSAGVCTPNAGLAGGACTSAGACSVDNAACVGGTTCTCNTNFIVDPTTLHCAKAGAITASMLITLLVGVISQMLVRL